MHAATSPSIPLSTSINTTERRVFDVFKNFDVVQAQQDQKARASGTLGKFDAAMDLDEEIGHLRMHRSPNENQDSDDFELPALLSAEDVDSEDEDDEDDDDGDDEVEERPQKAQKQSFLSNVHSILSETANDPFKLSGSLFTNTQLASLGTDIQTMDLNKASVQSVSTPSPPQPDDKPLAIPADFRKTITERAQTISGDTQKEYIRHCNKLETYAQHHGFIKPGHKFICKEPHPDAAEIIQAWIMDKCDSQNPDGTMKPAGQKGDSFSHADKMRAGALWGFQQIGLVDRWHKNEVTGKMTGNPVASFLVSKYMTNLKRQKILDGEVPTSSRAITAGMILDMYNASRENDNYDIKPIEPKRRLPTSEAPGTGSWCGGRMRRLLHFVYVISFLCLLRIDEALKIEAHNIKLIENYDEHGYLMVLTLPFRKTHQYGDIKPFYLREMPAELGYLCPIRAYTAWVLGSGIKRGFLCRKIGTDDRVDLQDPDPMPAQTFLAAFRDHLFDVRVDGDAYGGHSFRRGGVQWLSLNRRWPLRKICEWGGWSQEFTHLTIVKYLISWNDDPMFKRENFFCSTLPVDAEENTCAICKRSCTCAY